MRHVRTFRYLGLRPDALVVHEVIKGEMARLRIEWSEIGRVTRGHDSITVRGTDGKAITSMVPRRKQDGSPLRLIDRPAEARRIADMMNGMLGKPVGPELPMSSATGNFLLSTCGLAGLSALVLVKGGAAAWPFLLPLLVAFAANAYRLRLTRKAV